MPSLERYSRQIVLGRIGKTGQRKLLGSHVTVVGLGALGTTISTLLARAGRGRLRRIDRDVVELVNLQRQILYDEGDIGLPKAAVAADRIKRINSSIKVEGIAKDVNITNVLDLLDGSDVVVDGTDNLETRFVVNEACVEMGIPWVYGGAIGTEGRAMAIVPGKTACFRCFTKGPPSPGLLPTCETAGILNSVATATASLEVTEAIKLLLGDEPSGYMAVLDGWEPELLRIKVERSRTCPVCVGGKREYLGGRSPSVFSTLCGRSTVSFDPLHKGDLDMAALARRLRKIGKVRRAGSIILLEVGGYGLTIFPDGRALIKGTEKEEVAKSLYSKYIGL